MGIKQFILRTLEKVADENTRKIVVSYRGSTPFLEELGSISYIQICEREIKTKKDFDKWQERIQLSTIDTVYYVDREKSKIWKSEFVERYYLDGSERKYRDIKDVIEDIKKSKLIVSFCVRVMKQIDEKEYIVKLFDKYLRVKSKFIFSFTRNPQHYKYQWLRVLDEKENSVDVEEIRLLSDKEAVIELL